MKPIHILSLSAAAALVLGGCRQEVTESVPSESRKVALGEAATEPAAAEANAAVELAKQAVGKKLLGNTVKVAGDAFVAADLATAPEYYLVYYSASW
ncbi:MAG: hypothetical protein HKN82_17830 [Akkermansiaceae bacterium]|nr:hypothetical protein [Akkermansiaceae bacterium]NNM28769.1 hypothetical protein [Akkermansiaceae bacterium]